MCEQFRANRALLSGLVFEKRHFTIEAIIAAYKAIRGNAIIDGSETIRGFLKGLEELGTLRFQAGEYHVVEG